MTESDYPNAGDEPTEMTAMTGGSQSEAVAVSLPLNGGGTVSISTSGCSKHLQKAWLKRQLRTPAGKCVFFFAFLGFTILISYLITKIVMGVMYISECPLDPFIPSYLLVSSFLLLVFIIVLIILVARYHGRPVNEDRVSPIHLISLVYYFIHLVVQLAGSVCVIRTYNQIGDEDLNSHSVVGGGVFTATTTDPVPTCSATLLTFAFGVVILELVLSGLCLLLTVVTLIEVIYIICFNKGPC